LEISTSARTATARHRTCDLGPLLKLPKIGFAFRIAEETLAEEVASTPAEN
jgi:hypothetical protein